MPRASPRPPWAKLCRSLSTLGPVEVRRRWDQAQLLLRDNGVSYDVYGDPAGCDAAVESFADPGGGGRG